MVAAKVVQAKAPQKSQQKGKGKKPSALKKKKKIDLKYTIECESPIEDGILKLDNLVDFLKERVKFNGKKGQLDVGGIEIGTDKTKVVVTSKSELSKRYLKYLTKKYLKRHALRDWIRVVANNKTSYEMRYYNINDGNDDEGSEASAE